MLTFKNIVLALALLLPIRTEDHPADKLVYHEPASLLDKEFKVVWAYGNAVANDQVSLRFSIDGPDHSFQMSGNCDFGGSYSLGEGSAMDWNWEGAYTACSEPNVKNAVDHWTTNRDVNKAQTYILHASAFGSSWCMIGDKDHQGNHIMPLVGQHVLSHPKFLDKHYAIQKEIEAAEATP